MTPAPNNGNPVASSGYGLFFPGAFVCNSFMGGCPTNPNMPMYISIGVYGLVLFMLFKRK